MSDQPRRPASARPRSDVNEHEGMAPPSAHELAAIEQSQLDWAALQGATVINDEELGAVLIHHSDSGPSFNTTARIRWSANEVAGRLEALERRMRNEGRWPSIVFSEGLSEPGDLPAQLAAAGWHLVHGEQTLYTRHAPIVPHLDPGLRVEAVTRATAFETAHLEAEAFGLPSPNWIPERTELIATAVESGTIRAFLLRLVGEPVATLRLTSGDRVAGIHGVGVAAKHRRRGYGRMITAIATRAGLATGHGLVWLTTDNTNAPALALYQGLGYVPAFKSSRWLAPDR